MAGTEGERRLAYRRPLQCAVHEVAGGSPAEAEMIVGGFSLCYPCANRALGDLLNQEIPVLTTIRDAHEGRWDPAP